MLINQMTKTYSSSLYAASTSSLPISASLNPLNFIPQQKQQQQPTADVQIRKCTLSRGQILKLTTTPESEFTKTVTGSFVRFKDAKDDNKFARIIGLIDSQPTGSLGHDHQYHQAGISKLLQLDDGTILPMDLILEEPVTETEDQIQSEIQQWLMQLLEKGESCPSEEELNRKANEITSAFFWPLTPIKDIDFQINPNKYGQSIIEPMDTQIKESERDLATEEFVNENGEEPGDGDSAEEEEPIETNQIEEEEKETEEEPDETVYDGVSHNLTIGVEDEEPMEDDADANEQQQIEEEPNQNQNKNTADTDEAGNGNGNWEEEGEGEGESENLVDGIGGNEDEINKNNPELYNFINAMANIEAKEEPDDSYSEFRDLSPIPTKPPAKTNKQANQQNAKKKATIKKKPARRNQWNSRKKRTNKKKVTPNAKKEENQDSFEVPVLPKSQKKVTTLDEILHSFLRRSQLFHMAKDPDFSKWIKGKYVRFLHKMNMAEDDKSTQQKFKYKIVQILGVQEAEDHYGTGLHSPDVELILGWENLVMNSKLYSISDSQPTLEEFAEWLNKSKNMAPSPSLKYVNSNTKSVIIQEALREPTNASKPSISAPAEASKPSTSAVINVNDDDIVDSSKKQIRQELKADPKEKEENQKQNITNEKRVRLKTDRYMPQPPPNSMARNNTTAVKKNTNTHKKIQQQPKSGSDILKRALNRKRKMPNSAPVVEMPPKRQKIQNNRAKKGTGSKQPEESLAEKEEKILKAYGFAEIAVGIMPNEIDQMEQICKTLRQNKRKEQEEADKPSTSTNIMAQKEVDSAPTFIPRASKISNKSQVLEEGSGATVEVNVGQPIRLSTLLLGAKQEPEDELIVVD